MSEGGRPPVPGRIAAAVEAGVLTLLVALLLVLGGAQIVLRNVYDSGLPWADPLMRATVLWLGLAGAVAAARELRHIRIDLARRWLGGRPRAVLEALASSTAAVVSALIAWHGGRMVLGEMAYGYGAGFGPLPAWLLQLIIPGAFGLMGILYAVHGGRELLRLRRP